MLRSVGFHLPRFGKRYDCKSFDDVIKRQKTLDRRKIPNAVVADSIHGLYGAFTNEGLPHKDVYQVSLKLISARSDFTGTEYLEQTRKFCRFFCQAKAEAVESYIKTFQSLP